MKVYELVIEDFKIKKEVTSDGIYAMSALSGSWKNGFLSHLDEYWNYLIFALGKQEDIELFKSAIGSLADLSRSCESGFEKYLPQVVPALIKCLHVKIDGYNFILFCFLNYLIKFLIYL